MENKQQSSILHSLENAFRVIELFRDSEELGVSQISRELSLAKSTAYRLLTTMEKWGYVKKNEETDRYRLGMKFAIWGSLVQSRNEIVRLAHPHLAQLSSSVNEIVFLGVLEDDFYVRYLDRLMTNTVLSAYGSPIGNRMPAYSTACGKVLLAHLPPAQLAQYMEKATFEEMTPTTITSKSALLQELEQIRACGFGEDNEESERGLSCFAVPVKDGGGRAIAAVSISGPTGRVLVDREIKLEKLLETAKNIAVGL